MSPSQITGHRPIRNSPCPLPRLRTELQWQAEGRPGGQDPLHLAGSESADWSVQANLQEGQGSQQVAGAWDLHVGPVSMLVRLTSMTILSSGIVKARSG